MARMTSGNNDKRTHCFRRPSFAGQLLCLRPCFVWLLQVQLARDACDDAKIALDLEPHNDLAHHLMGRWHYGACNCFVDLGCV